MAVPKPPREGDERQTLVAFLDYYRAVVADKASGLTSAQLDMRLGPSTLTLGGIVHHLALVENWWFHQVLLGLEPDEPWKGAPWGEDRDWDFTVAASLDPQTILDRYGTECERARAAVDSVGDLERVSVWRNARGEGFSLRWILVHMIEETARHAGHADLIRESIDGATGDFRDDGE
ncbi:MAG TPA: DinB family protein [Acidimicrobiia bacterium]